MKTESPIQTSRPLYFLGLLCLIPLVGAFVGLVLLLFGLIKYKDKWLVIIGAFGIVFTIVIYSWLFVSMKHSDTFKEGFSKLSQMQLNSLVKNVEFYKLQNAEYPERLEQLQEDDQLVPIHDVIQGARMKPNSYYHYERVGDKYLLFSSGPDGVPHTKDDLYPQITIRDSSKIGLIFPK